MPRIGDQNLVAVADQARLDHADEAVDLLVFPQIGGGEVEERPGAGPLRAAITRHVDDVQNIAVDGFLAEPRRVHVDPCRDPLRLGMGGDLSGNAREPLRRVARLDGFQRQNPDRVHGGVPPWWPLLRAGTLCRSGEDGYWGSSPMDGR